MMGGGGGASLEAQLRQRRQPPQRLRHSSPTVLPEGIASAARKDARKDTSLNQGRSLLLRHEKVQDEEPESGDAESACWGCQCKEDIHQRRYTSDIYIRGRSRIITTMEEGGVEKVKMPRVLLLKLGMGRGRKRKVGETKAREREWAMASSDLRARASRSAASCDHQRATRLVAPHRR